MRPRFVKLDFEAAYDDYVILTTVNQTQTLVHEPGAARLIRNAMGGVAGRRNQTIL